LFESKKAVQNLLQLPEHLAGTLR